MSYYSGENTISNSKLWKGDGFEIFRKDVWREFSTLPQQIEKYRPKFSFHPGDYQIKDVIYDVNQTAKLVMGLVTIAEMEKPSSQESDHTKGSALSHFIGSCAQTLSQLSKLHQSFSEMAKSYRDEMKAELLTDEYETMLTKNNTPVRHVVLCSSPDCGQPHVCTVTASSSASSPLKRSPTATHSSSFPETPKMIVLRKKEEMFALNKILEETSLDSRISVFYLTLCLVQRAVHEHPKTISWLFGKIKKDGL